MAKKSITKILLATLGLAATGIIASASYALPKAPPDAEEIVPIRQENSKKKTPSLCYPLDKELMALNPLAECFKKDEEVTSQIYSYKKNSFISLDQLIESLSKERIIYLGESHQDYFMHLNKAAIIEGLAKKNNNIIIAMEMFQTKEDQEALDKYMKGEISIKDMQKMTKTDITLRFNFNMIIADTFRVAKAYNLKVKGMDILLVHYDLINRFGMDRYLELAKDIDPKMLSEKQRDLWEVLSKYSALSRQIDKSWDEQCKEEGKCIFMKNPPPRPQYWGMNIQLTNLRNDIMAERIISLMEQYPDHQIVFLNGQFHSSVLGVLGVLPRVEPYNYFGVPERVIRQTGVDGAIILQYDNRSGNPLNIGGLVGPEDVKLNKDKKEFPDYTIHVNCKECNPLKDYSGFGL